MMSSTSPSNTGGRRGPSLAVIDTPAAPPGWEGARTELIRIVDPLGRAVAWLAPAFGGRCVGFAVRPSDERGTAWVQLFHSVAPAALREAAGETGCRVACAVATPGSRGTTEVGESWRFVERDPTAAVLAATLGGAAAAPPRPREGREDRVSLRFSAALDAGTLALDLAVANGAAVPCRLRPGLHLSFDGSVLGDATGAIRADLPGRPLRQETADVRVDIPPGALVRLGGSDTTARVEIGLIAGVSRLSYAAPGGRAFASLLASAAAPPDGMTTLEAGATFRMAVALRATLD